MDNATLEYMYGLLLEKIPEPSIKRTVWKDPQHGERLGVCLIEFRQHTFLKAVLHNMCNVYGGGDTCIYIVHGTANEEFIKNIVKDWTNVKMIRYEHPNVTIDKYNDILTSVEFYNHFATEFVLIFQTDSLIRKEIPEEFFQYKYVGAPWIGYPNDFQNDPTKVVGNKRVGNGGFSLRHVAKMKEVCAKYVYKNDMNEDVFITNRLSNADIPSVEKAKEFAVEWVYYPDPVGLHHVYTIFTFDVVREWFTTIIGK